ncbi:MAG: thiamine pyrophosphate-binding protein [Sandaracinaceae bacterium]
MSDSPTVLDTVLRYLAAEQVEYVFGVPGGLLHPFFEAAQNSEDLTLVVTKHEGGAAFMADGYARVGNRLAVCASTAGPGATNMLTGVSVAYADGVPMLVLTGQVPSNAIGRGAAQESGREDMDIVAMFQPVTKYSAMITGPGDATHHLRRALRLALSNRPGPVHLNVPVDLWSMPLAEDWLEPEGYRPRTSVFDRAAVQRAADALLEAERPVILCGSGVGVAGAREHLMTLAELLPAKVATTPRAKGLFPEDHPLSLGVLGYAGHRAAERAVLGTDCDVLLVAGSSLNETTTSWNPAIRPSGALIHLDVDVDRIGRTYPVDVPLLGDAQTVLVELVYHLHREMRDGHAPRSVFEADDRLRGPRPDSWYLDAELRQSDQIPLAPQRWRKELAEVLPDGAVVFSDIGGHMLFNIHHLCIGGDQRFLVNMGFASMGHGTNAPIGAAFATDDPVIAIVGDACFAMNGMDLLTAAELDVPVLWIVENNHMHGITYHGSKLVGDSPLTAVRYRRNIEVAAIARAMGIDSYVVDRPGQLAEAVTRGLSMRRPCLIEVRVDGELPPPLKGRARSVKGQR